MSEYQYMTVFKTGRVQFERIKSLRKLAEHYFQRGIPKEEIYMVATRSEFLRAQKRSSVLVTGFLVGQLPIKRGDKVVGREPYQILFGVISHWFSASERRKALARAKRVREHCSIL